MASQNIQNYCKKLTADLVQNLPDYGYQIEAPNRRGHHMFGIRLPQNITHEKLQQQLDENNIYVSVRGSAVRISPNVYNDRQDISALFNVLKML